MYFWRTPKSSNDVEAVSLLGKEPKRFMEASCGFAVVTQGFQMTVYIPLMV